jgi:hypothetical protein
LVALKGRIVLRQHDLGQLIDELQKLRALSVALHGKRRGGKASNNPEILNQMVAVERIMGRGTRVPAQNAGAAIGSGQLTIAIGHIIISNYSVSSIDTAIDTAVAMTKG